MLKNIVQLNKHRYIGTTTESYSHIINVVIRKALLTHTKILTAI